MLLIKLGMPLQNGSWVSPSTQPSPVLRSISKSKVLPRRSELPTNSLLNQLARPNQLQGLLSNELCSACIFRPLEER